MTDIARWIVEAAEESGRRAALVTDRLPVADGSTNLVLAPHEFFVLFNADDRTIADAAAVSIPICTEQPRTPWFNLAAGIVRESPLIVDINQHGVDEFQRRDMTARRLQLGGVPSMQAASGQRDIDVLFLGGNTTRRAAVLASTAPVLWDRDSEIRLFRFSAPVHGRVPGVVFGQDKYELLARSRILLNVHRDDHRPGYFEWARMIEAMANGCAVLTEPSAGFEPLQAGVHFIESDDLAVDLSVLLDDPERVAAVAEAGRRAVLEEFPLVASLAPLLDEIDRLQVAKPARSTKKPARRTHNAPLWSDFRPADQLRRDVYLAFRREQRLLREIAITRSVLLHGDPDPIEVVTSPSYDTATPDVSVIVTLYNYADVVGETLDSIVASRDVNLEIVIVDDHSKDASRQVVKDFIAAHPEVPIKLLGREVNSGLARARNLAVENTRAELVMVMDADNTVYPTCLQRLVAALDADPEAAFAYATLEAFGTDPGLRSEMAWFPRWLCESNYIDAQALIRRSTFTEYGGYLDDDDFAYGWEDWELWLRLAEQGRYGVHVAEMLGRYRTQSSSMITITNLAASEVRAHIRELHPGLPWPEDDA